MILGGSFGILKLLPHIYVCCFSLFIKQSLWRQSSFDKVLKDTAGMPCLPTDMTNICVDTSGPNRGRTIDSNPSGNPTR